MPEEELGRAKGQEEDDDEEKAEVAVASEEEEEDKIFPFGYHCNWVRANPSFMEKRLLIKIPEFQSINVFNLFLPSNCFPSSWYTSHLKCIKHDPISPSSSFQCSRPDVNLFFIFFFCFFLHFEHGSCHIISSYPFVCFTKEENNRKPRNTVNKNLRGAIKHHSQDEMEMKMKRSGWVWIVKIFHFFFSFWDTTEAKLIYFLWWRMGVVAKAFYFPWFLFSTRSFGVISYYTRPLPPLTATSILTAFMPQHQHSDGCCI